MTPFYFVPLVDELKKANDSFESMAIYRNVSGDDRERQRSAFVLGWIQNCYQALYEYLQVMQEESND